MLGLCEGHGGGVFLNRRNDGSYYVIHANMLGAFMPKLTREWVPLHKEEEEDEY